MEETIEHKSWWKRNWKWAVPTGGCLLIIILLIVFVGSVVWGVTSVLSDSQAHQDAMERVEKNARAIELLGEPIEPNGMTGGNFSTSNGFKTAEITIPIKGPKGEATIRVKGEGMDETWTYEVMDVYIKETQEKIDLLTGLDNLN